MAAVFLCVITVMAAILAFTSSAQASPSVIIDRLAKGKSSKELHENYSKGHAVNTDLLSGATINIAELSYAVKNAVDGKTEDGGYSVKVGTSYNSTWGLYIANVIFHDGKIVRVLVDRVSNSGEDSKEKHDNYGIRPVSSIGKEWWEQTAYFEDYVLQHGIESVKYGDDDKATDADILSGATIGIGDFTRALLDALSH